MKRSIISVAIITAALSCSAQDLKSILLPEQIVEGGKPLMICLKNRKSSREFRSEALPLQTLSNLLWAAWGINRPEDGRRTAPSAMNWQEMDVYVVLAEGVYLYDAKANLLKLVAFGDHRKDTGRQGFAAMVPVNLVYVADMNRVTRGSPEDQTLYTAADAGFIAENVYLYCVSENLACVVRGSIERDKLAKALQLRPDQKIILAQTVGLPTK